MNELPLIMISIGLIAWYVIGVTGFLFFWTRDYGCNSSDIGFSLIVGIFGPLVWPMGIIIHGNGLPSYNRKRK